MKITQKDFMELKIKSLVNPNILNIKNHPKIPYVSSIQILTDNFKLEKVGDILNYWKENKIEDEKLNDINWMYVYCIKYGFMKKLDQKNINIYGSWKYTDRKYNLTQNQANEYLSQLEKMNEVEIKKFLSEPFNVFANQIIEDGTHRCCSMIGHILQGGQYIDMNINLI